ncbi:alpha/beta hydrolase fold domain-containing protein [Saccharopolyspora sp. HNM0983]|uniref:Alpha/beta hydrolase fold domain-containing protein n=1 Tax=Saccharopolyspora montiporae TaxID=2781240 RepID=A0A929B8P6_9PSEU|nr:alpha/beta hydrolase [Saccharopolyspora sp. HNM0983]MBE9375302.1 alpha/beta hydrolase fold domain-containing protein [Saccharopolyspora sp. HNM0983]
MSVLSRPPVARLAARAMQRATRLADRAPLHRFPEFPRRVRALTVPNSVAAAPAVAYLPADTSAPPPVHVNLHGGGFVLGDPRWDDALCRLVAAEAGVAVVNVDYALAPRHPFPQPPQQIFEILGWIARHGAEQGWDGARITVGGQSAGANLAAAAARLALERGGPDIALQVLHYPPLDLVTPTADKPTPLARPALRPWMGEIFNASYVPPSQRFTDRLASPAHPADTAALHGIAPALVITAEYDLLREEGVRYAERLRAAGALVELHEVAGADHGYDMADVDRAREVYSLIAARLRDG